MAGRAQASDSAPLRSDFAGLTVHGNGVAFDRTVRCALNLVDTFGLLFPEAAEAGRQIARSPDDDGPMLRKTDLVGWVSGVSPHSHEFGRDVLGSWASLAAQIAKAFPALVGAGLNPILHLPPRSPYDVFAVAALFLEQSGTYPHIQFAKGMVAGDAVKDWQVEVTRSDLREVEAAARAWRGIPFHLTRPDQIPEQIRHVLSPEVWPWLKCLFESWLGLVDAAGATAPRELCRHAWRLMAIADEAAKRTGFTMPLDGLNVDAFDGPWFEFDASFRRLLATDLVTGNEPSANADLYELDDLVSLSQARQDVACVLPKVRTSSVGCTLRSLSHHLCLLPGVGSAKAAWTPTYERTKSSDPMPAGRLNMLLVPFPYTIPGHAFVPAITEAAGPGEARHGYFDVDQTWLKGNTRREEIVTFVSDLVVAAEKDVGKVDVIVFPELSLDYATFAALEAYVQDRASNVELLVAGVSDTLEGRRGNFVSVASFGRSGSKRRFRESTREKHHRWKLEASQIIEYGLSGVLSPELAWWENIDLFERQVNFTVFRNRSVLAALICEDLARIDPCQQLVRAVGPNLVVALLMDAPQVGARWPARYATILAEDPGCSVLTLTSRGLMTRQHRIGTHRSTGERTVAMWRDDANTRPIQIDCPYDAQAVVLTLVEHQAVDHSLDGRQDLEAKAWRHAGHLPVRVAGARQKHAHILGDDDLAC